MVIDQRIVVTSGFAKNILIRPLRTIFHGYAKLSSYSVGAAAIGVTKVSAVPSSRNNRSRDRSCRSQADSLLTAMTKGRSVDRPLPFRPIILCLNQVISSPRVTMITCVTPLRKNPSFFAAASDKSMKGKFLGRQRSLIRTTTSLRLARSITLSRVPRGRL